MAELATFDARDVAGSMFSDMVLSRLCYAVLCKRLVYSGARWFTVDERTGFVWTSTSRTLPVVIGMIENMARLSFRRCANRLASDDREREAALLLHHAADVQLTGPKISAVVTRMAQQSQRDGFHFVSS